MSSPLSEACSETLRAWSAPSPAQEQLRQHYLDHLNARPDGWSRDCPGAHLTASSLICAPGGRVLLALHAKLGRWLQTGGHLEAADADLEAAALREAQEESGLSALALDPDPLLLSRHEVPCGPVRPCFHLDVQYLIRTPSAAPPSFGAESSDVQWFRVEALPDTDDSVRELVTAGVDRVRTRAVAPAGRGGGRGRAGGGRAASRLRPRAPS